MAKAVIASVNDKGGVGKTTTVVNLAAGLAARAKWLHPEKPGKVLFIDLDPSGNGLLSIHYPSHQADRKNSIHALLTQMPPPTVQRLIRQSEHYPNLFFIPSNTEAMEELAKDGFGSLTNREGRLAKALKPIFSDFEYILIDTPPGITYFLYNALVASTHVIIPVEMSYLGTLGLIKIEKTIQEVRDAYDKELPILGYIPSMLDSGQIEPTMILEKLNQRYPGKVFEPIHRSTDVKYAHSSHMDVFTMRPARTGSEGIASSSRSTQEFAQLVDRIAQLVNGGIS